MAFLYYGTRTSDNICNNWSDAIYTFYYNIIKIRNTYKITK